MKTKILMALAAVVVAGCSSNKENATGPGSMADFKAKAGDRVHFDFDESCITREAKATLASQATWLKANASKKATVIGKCDERGTREYNIALGQRRAENARTVLEADGVTADRLSVVSYGKDRPEVPNATTDAEHAQNRVALTEIAG
jgi:peptidoglycan-associated lipoprotein